MKLLIKTAVVISGLLALPNVYSFDIYGFIPWKTHITTNGSVVSDFGLTKQYITQQGFKPIKVVYHKYFLTNDQPDPEKIKKIAEDSKFSPATPISFDIEIGNRFAPKTVLPIVKETLRLYHQYGGAAPVGVYALLPQNTYGGKLDSGKTVLYTDLNKKYESIAKQVDFLSPVFYNYDQKNIDLWKKSVDFSMAESKKYAKKYNLKIIPYITSTYAEKKDKYYVEQMSEKEMQQRLTYLKNAGANGVIIWESSEGFERSTNGKPAIDFSKGWAKVVKDFK